MKKCIVAGCIIEHKGKVLLIKHKKLRVWLYPGGHIEDNEHPHEAAIREAREETGMRVRLVSCKNISIRTKEAKTLPMPFAILLEHVPYSTGAHLHFDLVYAAKPVSMRIGKRERTKMAWFSKDDVSRLDTYENVKQVLIKYFEECEKEKGNA